MEFNQDYLLLDFRPGFVSAFFFILFDLLLNTIIDNSFSRLVCLVYHNQVRRGVAIRLKSADFVGLTSYLVGERSSLVNIIITLLKIGFYSYILYIEISIDFKEATVQRKTYNTGRFIFDPSQAEWADNRLKRKLVRPSEFIHQCFKINESNYDQATFYSVSFNLTNNQVIDNEILDDYEGYDENSLTVNESTIECMSSDNVAERDTKKMLTMQGCSPFKVEKCSFEKTTKIALDEKLWDESERVPEEKKVDYKNSFPIYYIRQIRQDRVMNAFKSYTELNFQLQSMTCVTPNRIFKLDGPGEVRFLQIPQTSRQFEEEQQQNFSVNRLSNEWSCILIARGESTTLVELWNYNESDSNLTRFFPGPVFDKEIDIGNTIIERVLYQSFHSFSWKTFSELIVSEGVVYERFNETFGKELSRGEVTTIPIANVVTIILMILVVLVMQILIRLYVRYDKRPQINTISGLSSVARELEEPSTNSLVKGPGIKIGLSSTQKSMAHFGPIKMNDIVTTRSMNPQIE